MASATLQGKSVRELQELARETPLQPRRRSRPGLSRSARLHLIDILSRWSGLGLALIAGVSVYMAMIAGRMFPGRAAAWAAMILGALWVARRLRSQFRSGASLSSKPFRWRASFTASLSVLGVILASAPILLAPAGAPALFSTQILALSVTACFAASLLAAAHLPSAAAFAGPAAIFAVLTGLRAGDSGLLAASFATSLLGLTGIYLAHRYLEKNAAQAYPRTTLVRREAPRRQGSASSETSAATALKA